MHWLLARLHELPPITNNSFGIHQMATITKKLAIAGAFAPLAVFAEGESTIPGLGEAISQAQSTATNMAGQIVPGAVSIVFAFAGLLGVYLVWKILRRAAR